jgi:hypothetical protein
MTKNQSGRHRLCHEIAAAMLSANPKASPGKLHNHLYDFLSELDDMCRRVGSGLVSRQVIAITVSAWQVANPGEEGYQE